MNSEKGAVKKWSSFLHRPLFVVLRIPGLLFFCLLRASHWGHETGFPGRRGPGLAHSK